MIKELNNLFKEETVFQLLLKRIKYYLYWKWKVKIKYNDLVYLRKILEIRKQELSN